MNFTLGGAVRASAMLICMLFSFTVFSQKDARSLEAMRQRILADTRVAEVAFSSERETPSLITFHATQHTYKAAEIAGVIRNLLNLRTGYDHFQPTKQTQLFTNIAVPEYQQYFKGVKVEYSRYKALLRQDDVVVLAGSYYPIEEALTVQPSINEAQALGFARQYVNANKYAWEEVADRLAKATKPQVKTLLQAELKSYLPKGELVIVKDFTKEERTEMRLAFKFNIYASEPLSRGYVFVDAHTGKILLYNRIIKHASVPTTVNTRYAGARQIYTKQISGNDPANGLPLVSSHPLTEPTYIPGSPTYVLIDDTRGNGIETYDLNGVGGLPLSVGAVYTQAKSFTDVDNNWTVAEHKRGMTEGGAAEAENDDIAWDAHWGAEMVYDYWKLRQNRLSYDDKNAVIKSYIHYGPAYDNAFWNGSVMTYGDGSGQPAGFKALTSLDVCAHEIGHGICSFTSDLVYEKESGAMNEAFSDIWGACVENYVIKQVDPALAARYRPFYIGEQISYTTTPLRTMDNPKATSNPDTYGGQYWQNPDCTPTLANDQCGVHTNSGVLNKWFYLLTCGSGAGSGPDVSYVLPGADDGINDLGSTYSVTGLGFQNAERIAYLTELLLSSTATFAEARSMSIAATSMLSGDPCGAMVQSVTNAWYAVGVGSAFSPSCTVTYGFVFNTPLSVPEGRNGFGCNGLDTLYIPIQIPANSTATISASGTATANVDYILLDASVSNTTASASQDTIRVVIINDGVVEDTETIILNITMSNTGANPTSLTYTINLLDDDVTPVIGADSVVLVNENFESYPVGFNQPAGWTETLELPEDPALDPQVPGKNQWGVFSNTSAGNTSKALAITGRLNAAGLGTLPPATYYMNSQSQTRITAPMIDARGLNTLAIRFDYTVQGEVDPAGTDPETFPKLDYMALAYSFDGVNYTEMGPQYTFASPVPTSGTFTAVLPDELNNKQFYLAFRWVNDALIGGPVSVAVDNLSLKALPRKIESQVSHAGDERVVGAQEVYFYSRQDREIITRINTSGAHNYGCVTATIESAGGSSFTLYNDGVQDHKVGEKVVRVTPATNNPSGEYSISLYLTEAEIQAIETSTTQPRTALFIYKTSAASIAGATAANTVKMPATYNTLPNNAGGVFTASFTDGFSAFAVGAAVTAPLPVSCMQFTASRNNGGVSLKWDVANETNNSRFVVERSTDGRNYFPVANVGAQVSASGHYQYEDMQLVGLPAAFYRVKQLDINGSFTYICKVLSVKLDGRILVIKDIYPNPAKGKAFVNITTSDRLKLQVEVINSLGQLISLQHTIVEPGATDIPVELNLASGNYLLRFVNEDGQVISRQKLLVR